MAEAPAALRTDGVRHGRRAVAAWIAVSAVATPLVAIFVGPQLPPGSASTQAAGQVFDNTWILSICTPVICFVLVFFAYSLFVFNQPQGTAIIDGPPLRNDTRVQVVWMVSTTVTVLFLAAFGSYELVQNGAGGGQGPSPAAVPAGHKLVVQVIGQQWEFTYRYPGLGDFETHDLVLPANTTIVFHVTSLDVVHSFWAYQLGVKADANPGVDNVAYVHTKAPGTFDIHCSELCGLWHGYMFSVGRVVPAARFHTWIASERKLYAPIAKYLPPFRWEYLPSPVRRGG